MKQIYLKSIFLSLLMIVMGNVGAFGAPGDEIKSPNDVVSGKSYYIKGVYTSNGTETACYYAPTDAKGKFTDNAVTDISAALPITFTQVDGGWTLTTPNGYYVRPHTSNGQTYLEENEVVLQLASGTTKEGTDKGVKIGPYVNGSDNWYIQCNKTTVKIGGYKNTQWDVTLIECGDNVSSAATFADTAPSIEFPATSTYSQEVTTAEGYTGTVTYEITANTAGATINGSTVTVTQAGSVTVKATAPAVEGFLSSAATYTLTVTDAREENGLAFAVSSQEISVGGVLNAPTLTNPNNLTVTYSSSDTSIATVDADGNVTGVAVGSATITATFEGNNQYMAGSASYTVNVKKALPEGALFYESVSGYNSSTDASNELTKTNTNLDSGNWGSFSKVYAGKVVGGATDGHLKFGTGSAVGTAVTGSIALTGNGKLTYKVMRYDSSNAGKLTISVTGADVAGDTEVTGTADWVEKTVYLSNATGNVVITFATDDSSKRIRVDDILLVEVETVETSSAATFAETEPSIDFPATNTYTQEATTAEGYTGTVTYEITANTAGATIDGSTVTVTKAGSVTVKATAPAIEGFLSSTATYTLTVNDARGECGLAFAESSQEISVGGVLNAPTLTNPNNLTVTYSSSDTSIATVDTDGNVTGVAVGSATITATFEGNNQYMAGSASYTVNVKKVQVLPVGVLFYESVSGYTGSSDNNIALSTTYSGLDSDNWDSFERVYPGKVVGGAADGHLKFGSSSAVGTAVTGPIALTGYGKLTYKVMRYDSSNAGKLTISVTGADVAGDTEVTGTADWVEKTVYLSNATGNVVITLATDGSSKRIRVDDIMLVETEAPKTYTLVAGEEEHAFVGLELTKELPAQTEFYIKDSQGNEYHSTEAQTELTIIAENHENLPTSANGKDFYLKKANTWVFTLTEGEEGAVTLTVSPQTTGETKYMLTSDYLQESNDVFDENNQLTKEMTTEGFYITLSDDYGITNLTPAESNISGSYIWEFSDDAPTVGFIPEKIINTYRVSKAGSYTFTLDLTNKTVTAEFISANQYSLVAGEEEYTFDGLELTKELPAHTEFTIKDSNNKVYYGSNNNDVNIINAENHENLPTYESGKGFYLSKANTWVFTLTEGEEGALTLTVNPETAGETKYMLTAGYLEESEDIFDANFQLTKEMTTEPFYITRGDDYGLTNLTAATNNTSDDSRYWEFSEDYPSVEFIVGEIRNTYAVAEAGTYTFTLDFTSNTVSVEKAPLAAMFCNKFFGYEAGTPDQKDDTKFEGDADGVTIVVNKGTSQAKMFVSDSELRVYKGNTMSFTAPNGYDITKIVFTPTSLGYWNGEVTADVGTMTDKTWEGKSETVLFSIGATNRLTKAEITLAPGKQSAALKFAVDEYRTETESGEVTDAPALTKDEGYDGTITYTSSDEAIATVDAQTGVVTAVAVGDVTITATGTETSTYNGGNASYVLHVGYLDAQMKFAKDAVTVTYGENVENTLSKKTSAEVTYASDNEAVASVDADGNVTVNAVGTVTITATAEKAEPYKAGEASYIITVEDKEGSEFGSKSCFYEPFDFAGGTGGNDGQFKGNVASSNFDTNYTGINTWTVKPSLGFNCARAGTGSVKGSATVSSIAVESGKTYHLNFKAAPFNEDVTVMDVAVEGGTIDGLSTDAMTNFKWNDLSATITATADELSLTFTADQNRFFLDEIRLADPTDLNTASVTIPASGWASYCCEYPLEFTASDEVKAYAVTGVSGNKATLTHVTGTIKGGIPLLINGAAGEHSLTVAENSTNEVAGNLLKGTLSPTYVEGETSEAVNYGLKSGELHAVISGTMPAGKAYLPIAKGSAAAGSKITFVFEDATGINQYQTIQTEGVCYDLQGRRVGNPQKGIYVRNGKKVVIK